MGWQENRLKLCNMNLNARNFPNVNNDATFFWTEDEYIFVHRAMCYFQYFQKSHLSLSDVDF